MAGPAAGVARGGHMAVRTISAAIACMAMLMQAPADAAQAGPKSMAMCPMMKMGDMKH